MAALTAQQGRLARLRRAREERLGDEYASAIGMIAAVVRPDTHPLRTVQQVREILAALDEVTGEQDD